MACPQYLVTSQALSNHIYRVGDSLLTRKRCRAEIAVSQTALAHHWLVTMGGGEKVLEQFSELFPYAPIYTLVATKDSLSKRLQRHKIVPFSAWKTARCGLDI